MMPMEGKASFKLHEVAKHTYAVPGGFYRGSFAVIMNQDTYDGLSDADRAAVDTVLGENLSRIAGQVWDKIDAVGDEALKNAADNSYTEASAEDTAAWQELTGPIIDKVKAEVSVLGIDADAAQAFIASEMAAN